MTDSDAPVVVTVYPKQDFWLTIESFPMHHTRCHPNLELSFFAALAHSADGMAVAPVAESTHPDPKLLADTWLQSTSLGKAPPAPWEDSIFRSVGASSSSSWN